MKTAQLDSNMISAIVAQVLGALEPNAKSSARVRETPQVEHMKSKKGRLEDVEINVSPAVDNGGRMKFPARMFVKGSTIIVNGQKFHQLASDQNRSEPWTPSGLLEDEVSSGDIVLCRHEGGKEWSATAVAGSRKKSPAKAKAKSNHKAERSAGFSVPEDAQDDPKSLIKFFGKVAYTNYKDEDFDENVNIKQSLVDAKKLGKREKDARIYLTTAQNQKLRRYRKALGLSLEEHIDMLNNEMSRRVKKFGK